MFGTTQEMDRPYSGGSVHADAQRLLYPYSRGVDSRSIASTHCHCCNYYRNCNHLPHLEVQT